MNRENLTRFVGELHRFGEIHRRWLWFIHRTKNAIRIHIGPQMANCPDAPLLEFRTFDEGFENVGHPSQDWRTILKELCDKAERERDRARRDPEDYGLTDMARFAAATNRENDDLEPHVTIEQLERVRAQPSSGAASYFPHNRHDTIVQMFSRLEDAFEQGEITSWQVGQCEVSDDVIVMFKDGFEADEAFPHLDLKVFALDRYVKQVLDQGVGR